MSTDFSIKPVGVPVAPPMTAPVSEAAQNAVPTELPPSRSVTAADAGTRASINSNVVSASVSNQIIIDRDTASVVFQVVDNRTSQVVRQFPEQAVLRRRAYFRTLDLTREAPTRLGATDRRA
jgi:uncharacterized FlaG/YvyC family protein